ncbi:MAG: CCA tRNA nucleotidyltransferase [Clostridium sp.]|nr:CCA tRNA nucleotidyltransferase [Clostridium sp.]
MNIKMPEGAAYIIKELNKHGFEAFIVGGCVRDALLGKEPSDWDITTSAKPEDIKRIFRHTVDTGIEHGTVTVLIYGAKTSAKNGKNHESFEVTTYRVDGAYTDHRRPDTVTFTDRLVEDLKRRDFTINAMAYNDESGLVDIFDGQGCLENGVIACVGAAKDRFDEDALRILRAIRFSAQLGFAIEEKTLAAMKQQSPLLAKISAERIQAELTKLITSDNPDRLITAYELGITKVILPEFDAMMNTEQNNPYHLYNVGVHTVKVMENIAPEPILRYTALLHDVGKPYTKKTGTDGVDHFYGHQEVSEKKAREILRRLKLDNHTIDKTCRLVLNHDYGIQGQLSEKNVRRFISRLGAENFGDFISIRKADMAGQSDYRLAERQADLLFMTDTYNKIKEKEQCLSLSDMKLSGKDLIEMGASQGKELGAVLKELFERVLDDPELNEHERLKEMAEKILSEKTANE